MNDTPRRIAGVELSNGDCGIEQPLTDVQTAIRDVGHRFACEVLRPIGQKLDRLPSEKTVAEDSPFWSVHDQARGLGFDAVTMSQLPQEDAALLQSLIFEEMGWGDSGLAVSLGVSTMPREILMRLGLPQFTEVCPEAVLGCWAITEPNHGSDMLDSTRQTFAAGGQYGAPNCIVREAGKDIVIDGQKSAWVSNGVVADHALLFCSYCQDDLIVGGCVVLVPLAAKGISRGRPLDKMGQRALPQGEIFFDDVRLPRTCLAVTPDGYDEALYRTLSTANAGMGAIFVGVARAAFDYALEYAHERRQGGVPILQHQTVRQRLFGIYRKVEAARALSRRVMLHNAVAARPSLTGAIASKIMSTQTAFEAASEAVQIFGGAGLSREYPVEKLLRDARSSMIEDGCNELLAIKGGSQLVDWTRM